MMYENSDEGENYIEDLLEDIGEDCDKEKVINTGDIMDSLKQYKVIRVV